MEVRRACCEYLFTSEDRAACGVGVPRLLLGRSHEEHPAEGPFDVRGQESSAWRPGLAQCGDRAMLSLLAGQHKATTLERRSVTRRRGAVGSGLAHRSARAAVGRVVLEVPTATHAIDERALTRHDALAVVADVAGLAVIPARAAIREISHNVCAV